MKWRKWKNKSVQGTKNIKSEAQAAPQGTAGRRETASIKRVRDSLLAAKIQREKGTGVKFPEGLQARTLIGKA